MKYDLRVISDELVLAGKLQLKKKFRLRRGLNPCLPDTSWELLPTELHVGSEANFSGFSVPRKFFSGFIFCNFFNCSLPARINSSHELGWLGLESLLDARCRLSFCQCRLLIYYDPGRQLQVC